jgi:hypothetical protein
VTRSAVRCRGPMRRTPHAGIPYSDLVLLSGRGDDASAHLFFSADAGSGMPPLDVTLPASPSFRSRASACSNGTA